MSFKELKTKKARIAYIKEMIAKSDKWAIAALTRIYQFQEESEKANRNTVVQNGVGFNSADADFMTAMAKLVIEKRNLTTNQMAIVKKGMPKYARQLENVSKSCEL